MQDNSNSTSEPLIDMIIPFPYFVSVNKKTRTKTQQLISLNNMSKWYRFKITEIKNEYKDLLKEFFIPEPLKKHKSLSIQYEVQRHNKRRVDSMNIVAFADKWLLDSLVETGWLSDDDNCFHTITPAAYREGITETQLRVIVRLAE